MANALYPLWKKSSMTELDINNSLDQTGVNACSLALVMIGAGGYTYSASHQYYNVVSGVQGTPAPMVNVTLTSNVVDADDAVFTNVTGTRIDGFVIYRGNAGASSTWRLVLYEDTGIVGFPMIPNGGNLLVAWSNQGIFAL